MNLLEKLKTLESHATPGPWSWLPDTSMGDHPDDWGPFYISRYPWSMDRLETNNQNNAELITEMRNALPHFLVLIEAAHEAVYNDNQDAQEKLHAALLVFLDDPGKKKAPKA